MYRANRPCHRQSKLSQEQLAELQKSTHFDKKELQQWYKGAYRRSPCCCFLLIPFDSATDYFFPSFFPHLEFLRCPDGRPSRMHSIAPDSSCRCFDFVFPYPDLFLFFSLIFFFNPPLFFFRKFTTEKAASADKSRLSQGLSLGHAE